MASESLHPQGRSRLAVPSLAGFVLGSALQLQQPALFARPVYATCLLAAAGLALWLWRTRRPRPWDWVLAGLAMALLGFGSVGWRAVAFQAGALNPALEGRDLRVTGTVAAMPQLGDDGLRFRLTVEDAQSQGRPLVLPPEVALGWYAHAAQPESEDAPALSGLPDLRAGERWQLTVRLKAPHGNSNPFGFDYELWLWEQGLQATGYVRAGTGDHAPRRLQAGWRHPVEQARQAVRDRVFARIAERDRAGVVAALVTGDQNAIERGDWDVFRATGVAHLMSISGLHVTMFAWLAAAAIGAAWRRSARLCEVLPAPHAALLGALALAGAYAVFSGWGVPSQRTVWMLCTVGLLRLSARRWPWPAVWLLACAVVVAFDPWALLQAGFWLSFVAVGVLFASGTGAQSVSGVASRLRAMLHEQWLITAALTPLTLLLFGQVSLVGFVANALAIPWVTLLVTPLSMGGVLVPALWDLAGWSVQALGTFLRWLAQWPWATVSVAQAPLWAGVTGLCGGLLLALRLPWPLRLPAPALLLPVLLWQPPRPAAGQFEMLAADIGQGNAVLVRTARHALLYDTGPRFSRESDAGHRVLVPLLRALDTRLDTVVVSHRDADHSGGAATVLAMQTQAQLLSSIERDHALQVLRPATRCAAGQQWTWDGVSFQVLHPLSGDYDAPARPNALSCVLRIASSAAATVEPRIALLAGDIERAQEARLVADGAPLRADVLLVPHHGSRTPSSDVFLDAVQPRLAIVQAGYRNRFGHPAREPLLRYRARQIRVLDSTHCGAVTWNSERPDLPLCQRQQALRYWQHTAP